MFVASTSVRTTCLSVRCLALSVRNSVRNYYNYLSFYFSETCVREYDNK